MMESVKVRDRARVKIDRYHGEFGLVFYDIMGINRVSKELILVVDSLKSSKYSGVHWTVCDIKVAINSGQHHDWIVDESYSPCKILRVPFDSIIHCTNGITGEDVYSVGDSVTEKPEKKCRGKDVDFFFPEDKMNPNRDPNSPWEFL